MTIVQTLPRVVVKIIVNGLDDNNNGLTDCADPACTGDPLSWSETDCTNGLDDDQDGFSDCDDYDCGIDATCVGLVEICTTVLMML